MIVIDSGKMNIPEEERFIGYAGDNLHSTKQFLLKNITEEDCVYRLYLLFDDGTTNYFVLDSKVVDGSTILIWTVLEEHILKSGTVKAQIKSISKNGVVYHTTSDYFIVADSAEFSENFSDKENAEFLRYERELNKLLGDLNSSKDTLVPKLRKIAGIDLSDDISAQELAQALNEYIESDDVDLSEYVKKTLKIAGISLEKPISAEALRKALTVYPISFGSANSSYIGESGQLCVKPDFDNGGYDLYICRGQNDDGEYIWTQITSSVDGKSAYDIAKENGFQGTEKEWLDSLKGADGTNGKDGTNGMSPRIGSNGNWFIGSNDTGQSSRGIQGEKGDKGDTGLQGPQGEKGEKGDTGLQGPQGEKGDKGDTGLQGPQGAKGNDGYTPVKGVDYFTEEDKTEIVEDITAISSVSVEYGRSNGASYYLLRIPRYTNDGKRIFPRVAITSSDKSISGTKVSALEFAKSNDTVLTVNGGLFNMSTMQPLGQTIVDGVSLTNTPMTDDNGTAIADDECYPLCIDSNGDLSAPYERNVNTSTMIANGVKYAVTAWGQFIENYALAPSSKFTEQVHAGKYVRQCIGQYQNGDYMVCTVDAIKGSLTENEAGMTYAELAELLISKGVKFAYSLDGGGSAETVLGKRQVNPIFEGTTGRSVPTVIYFTTQEDSTPKVDYTIYWSAGYSAFGINNNRPTINHNYLNRITAYQLSGDYPFHKNATAPHNVVYPITVPKGATKVKVSVPSGYVHGVIFYKVEDDSTTLINDYGWNGSEFTYTLANYTGTTHITVNVKNNSNSNIDANVDLSSFSVTFE